MALVARVIGQRGTASQPFATIWKRLLSDDGLSRLNIYKDAERAPKEMVCAPLKTAFDPSGPYRRPSDYLLPLLGSVCRG